MPALFCCASPETSLDFLSATSVGELASSPFTTGLPPSSLSPATVSALSALNVFIVLEEIFDALRKNLKFYHFLKM